MLLVFRLLRPAGSFFESRFSISIFSTGVVGSRRQPGSAWENRDLEGLPFEGPGRCPREIHHISMGLGREEGRGPEGAAGDFGNEDVFGNRKTATGRSIAYSNQLTDYCLQPAVCFRAYRDVLSSELQREEEQYGPIF